MGQLVCRPFGSLRLVATAVVPMICWLSSQQLAADESSLDALARLAREQQSQHHEVTPNEVSRARQHLLDDIRHLDAYLSTGGPTGAAWKRYLHFIDLLAAARATSAPPPEQLRSLLRRFRADHVGLEMPMFQNVAQALDDYMLLVREQQQPASAGDIDERLKQLSSRLAAAGDARDPDNLAEIGRMLGWLSDHGQSAELVARVRSQLSQPNLHVQVSDQMIAAGSLREIRDRPMPVRDVILGTSIVGTGRTSGWARTRLLPDASRGLFETTITAVNRAQTVGYNGPARIGTQSTTQLSGVKRFYLDPTGFHVWGATSTAEAHSQICGIWSNKHGLMDRVVRKVANKRVAQQKGEAEQIASRHAEVQLNARLNTEANAQLGRAHADFTTKFRNPLLRMAQWPRDLRIATTTSRFRLTALHDLPARLAAPTAAPAAPHDAAMVVQVHESMVNNYGDGLLAGQTIQQQQLDRLSLDLLGRRPPQLAHDEEKGPWSITFSSHEPVLLRVNDGKASLTIRGRRFASDIRTIDTPLDVTAHYRLLRENNAVKALREGELEVFPTGFVPNGEKKMSLRQSRDANFIRHRFDDFFTPEIVSQGLVLPGHWAQTGRLDLIELSADRGWVTLAWKMRESNTENEGFRVQGSGSMSQEQSFNRRAIGPRDGNEHPDVMQSSQGVPRTGASLVNQAPREPLALRLNELSSSQPLARPEP